MQKLKSSMWTIMTDKQPDHTIEDQVGKTLTKITILNL